MNGTQARRSRRRRTRRRKEEEEANIKTAKWRDEQEQRLRSKVDGWVEARELIANTHARTCTEAHTRTHKGQQCRSTI